MANKEKVNMDALKTYLEKTYSPTVDVKHSALTLTVKKHLSLTEMLSFVDGAVESCFVGDENKFMPEIREFAIRSGVFTMYLGLDLPEDMDERYDLLYSLSDVYYAILDEIDKTQLVEMCNAIDRKVDARVAAMQGDVTRYANEILGQLEGITEQYSGLFEGIEAEDVNNMIKAVAGGSFNIDEEKFVKAYLDQKKG